MADEIKKVESNESDDVAENNSKKIVLANIRKIFWVALAILILLLIFSVVVLTARMFQYSNLVDDGRLLNISADSIENFDIFSAEYKNDKDEITVASLSGDAVIAPGTDTDYTIRIRNRDDIAVDYEFRPTVEYIGELTLPLEVRLLAPDDTYILGSPKEWKTFDDFANISLTATLPKGEVHEYVLQWRWVFENDSDDHDTALGNAGEGNAGIKVGLGLHSEANLSKEANGTFFAPGVEDVLRIWIFFILLLIVIILLIISIIRRGTNGPEKVVVYVPTAVPTPVAEPVAAPQPKRRSKDKGFVGKMEYINIDTLVDNFKSGDKISLKILQAKGLIDPETTQMKILARSDMVLEKKFHIETQGISAQARQKVVAAGGTVKIIDG